MQVPGLFRTFNPFRISLVVILLTLAACGGSGSNGASSTIISGMVAAGAPVIGGVGYALDAATGTQVPFTTNATGSFSVNLNGYAGPFLLNVRGRTSGGSLFNYYSLATTNSFGKTVNVTPLSDIVVGYASGKTTSNLETTCTTTIASCPALLNGTVAKLALSNANIMNAIPLPVLSAFNVDPNTFNAISTTFTATHSGVDGLLDAIQVVPPTGAGTTYSVNLAGSTTPTVLVTVPVSTNTTATAPTKVTTPTTPVITKAANLAKQLGEVQVVMANLSALFATAKPTSGQLTPYFDAAYLNDGEDRTTAVNHMIADMPIGVIFNSGGLAPYSGAPLGVATTPSVNVTYDANNCVTSLWSYFGANGVVRGTVLLKNAIPVGNAAGICTGGTWTIAGNQRTYSSVITSQFMRSDFTATPTYSSGFHLETLSSQTTSNTVTPVAVPYATVTISGPGITTLGAPTGTNGTVILVGSYHPNLQDTNYINDPYYGSGSPGNPYYAGAISGSNDLQDCAQLTNGQIGSGTFAAASLSTPCLNMAAVVPGSDYTVKFYDAANTLLETDMERLEVAPTSIPTSWFPTITSVTPVSSTIPSAGGVVTASWTMPAGATTCTFGVNLNDQNYSKLRYLQPTLLASTSTSTTLTIPALPAAAGGSNNGLPGTNRSMAFLVTIVGGVFVINAVPY